VQGRTELSAEEKEILIPERARVGEKGQSGKPRGHLCRQYRKQAQDSWHSMTPWEGGWTLDKGEAISGLAA
jgi:hypothetical protein